MFDKLIKAPGKLAQDLAEAAAQVPTIPLDVAEKTVEGAIKGIEKATEKKS